MRYLLILFLLATNVYAASESATVSPDGKRIVFVSDRDGMEDLYVISADGTNEVRLTHTPEKEGRADWSRDGKQIWFSVFADNRSRIYSMNADGSNVRETGSVPGRSVRLSPDGKRTLYATGSWTEMALMVSDLDGSNAKTINDGKAIAWGPQWSSNGREIAFGSRGADKVLHVWVMNADGSHLRQLTKIASSAQMPAWSKDGKKLAVQGDHRIWIADAKSGAAHVIGEAEGTYSDEVPSWFPDGKRIAFQSNRTGRFEVWVMNADGSGQRQLTH